MNKKTPLFKSEYDNFILYTFDFNKNSAAIVYDKNTNNTYIGRIAAVASYDINTKNQNKLINEIITTTYDYDYTGEFVTDDMIYYVTIAIIAGYTNITLNLKDNYDIIES